MFFVCYVFYVCECMYVRMYVCMCVCALASMYVLDTYKLYSLEIRDARARASTQAFALGRDDIAPVQRGGVAVRVVAIPAHTHKYIHNIHTCIHTYIKYITYKNIYIYTYIHTCIHTYIHTSHTYMRMCIRTLHTYMHACNIHAHAHTHIHTYIPTHIDT